MPENLPVDINYYAVHEQLEFLVLLHAVKLKLFVNGVTIYISTPVLNDPLKRGPY